jgi:hypothetical protein
MAVKFIQNGLRLCRSASSRLAEALMKTQTFFLAVALAMAGSTPATDAQTTFLPQSETDAIVLKFQLTYADTFDRRDAKGMAALFNENATLQNEWGDVVQGRTNIAPPSPALWPTTPQTPSEDTPLVSHAVAADGSSVHLQKNQSGYHRPAKCFHTGAGPLG